MVEFYEINNEEIDHDGKTIILGHPNEDDRLVRAAPLEPGSAA